MSVQFQFDFEKTLAVLAYFAEHDLPSLDTYKVGKLLFLADKYHLVRYARPITGDLYWAMDYGPVPSDTYNILKYFVSDDLKNDNVRLLATTLELDRQYKHPRLQAKGGFNFDVLSKSDLMALQRTIAVYGQKTFEELKALTHEMPAYRKAWQAKPADKRSQPMKFEDFFEEDSEAMGGAFEEMLENDSLRKAFPVG